MTSTPLPSLVPKDIWGEILAYICTAYIELAEPIIVSKVPSSTSGSYLIGTRTGPTTGNFTTNTVTTLTGAQTVTGGIGLPPHVSTTGAFVLDGGMAVTGSLTVGGGNSGTLTDGGGVGFSRNVTVGPQPPYEVKCTCKLKFHVGAVTLTNISLQFNFQETAGTMWPSKLR